MSIVIYTLLSVDCYVPQCMYLLHILTNSLSAHSPAFISLLTLTIRLHLLENSVNGFCLESKLEVNESNKLKRDCIYL